MNNKNQKRKRRKEQKKHMNARNIVENIATNKTEQILCLHWSIRKWLCFTKNHNKINKKICETYFGFVFPFMA